jgi:hypothetical protein
MEQLVAYSLLSIQPINFMKTVSLFSARAIAQPKFNIFLDETREKQIEWVDEVKYLGYWISPKLGWGRMLKRTKLKVQQRVSMIRSFKFKGLSSPQLRPVLFSSLVLPIFSWIYPLFPLLTIHQRNELSQFYLTALRRVCCASQWNSNFFAFAFDEKTLEDRCASYWSRYLIALSDSRDGELLFEKANLNEIRKAWCGGNFPISSLRRSKRFVDHKSIVEKACLWLNSVPLNSSTPSYNMEEIMLLHDFPESF